MKAAVTRKIEQAKTRDTIGRNLAPSIPSNQFGNVLWDTQMSTGSNHSTKLTPVVLVDENGEAFVLQYVITRIVPSSQFKEAVVDAEPQDRKEDENDD